MSNLSGVYFLAAQTVIRGGGTGSRAKATRASIICDSVSAVLLLCGAVWLFLL